MQISHNRIISNYRLFFFKAILIYFFTLVAAFSNDLKIGSITEIIGEVIAINEGGDERILENLDQIFLKDEILIGESSSATLQFDDNTTIVMRELTSLNVNEFENSGVKKTFQAKVGKGKIIIESGAIAKNSNGEMLIDLSNMSLGIRGTRFNASIKPNGNSEVALAEDSFGNVGQIEISSEGQTTNLTSTDQVVEVTKANEVEQREQSEDEKEELKSVNETLVKVSKIDENELTEQLQEKLARGKLQDANNDGIVDETDIEAVKEIIKKEKKQKIDFIVENSSDENTIFLSNVIDQSDEQNIGETIEKIIETKDTLVESIVGSLSDKDNEFITSSTSEGAGLIKEKIFETIVAKETDKSAQILSKVMSKADETTVASVINNITEKNTNEQSKLSLKVMADFSEKNPEKLETLAQNNADQIEKLTISAVDEAQSSIEDANLIAKVIAVASDELANKVVEEVSKNSTEEKQTLSAQVLKAIVDSDSGKIDIINDDVRNTMIKQTIESAQNQQEGLGVQQDQDMTSIVSDIIVNSNTVTGSKIIEELNNYSTDTENNLSLQVISAISEKDTTKLNTLSENNKEQIETLTETAIKNADASEESADLIAKVVAVASDELVNKVVEEVSKNSTDENQALSAKVMRSIVDTNPDKIKVLNDENKEVIIDQTIEAAKNQAEAVLTDDIDLSNIIAEIITQSDIETAGSVIETLEEISNESDSKLSLNVFVNLTKQENYEEKIEILSVTSSITEQNITKLIEKAVENVSSGDDKELITDLVENSKGTIANKIINSANNNEKNKKVVSEIVIKIIEKNPEKAVEIIEKNENTNAVLETIKTKIENGEAVNSSDFDEVFDQNLSPN